MDMQLLARHTLLILLCALCTVICLGLPLMSMAEGTTNGWHVLIAFLVIPSVTGIHYGCMSITDYMHSLEDEE